MDPDRPPQELFDSCTKAESEQEKEEREKGIWPESTLDVKPCQLQVRVRQCGPPQLHPFRLGSVGPDYTMAFFGKRREGKSFAMRWILYHMRDRFPRGYVFTNTKINGFWQEFVPEKYVFNGYSEAVMAKIIASQESIVTWMQKNPCEAKQVNPYIFVVLEDCMNQDLHHQELLKSLFYNGRHLKMFLLISLQYARGVPPGFRENVDMAFLFRLHSASQIEAVAENFLGHLDKKDAKMCLETAIWKDQETGDRQFLVVDNSGNSDIDNMLYVGHAADPGDFKLGCKQYWENEF
jgi:hypothetical protein